MKRQLIDASKREEGLSLVVGLKRLELDSKFENWD